MRTVQRQNPLEPWAVFLLGLLVTLVSVVLVNSILYSCDNARSMEQLESCQDPQFVGTQRMRYGRMLYHYKCADGHVVSSSVEVK